MPLLTQIDLHCDQYGSDKVYHVAAVEVNGRFHVVTRYGARGVRHLLDGKSFECPSEQAAVRKAESVANAKRTSRGYHDAPGISGNAVFPYQPRFSHSLSTFTMQRRRAQHADEDDQPDS